MAIESDLPPMLFPMSLSSSQSAEASSAGISIGENSPPNKLSFGGKASTRSPSPAIVRIRGAQSSMRHFLDDSPLLVADSSASAAAQHGQASSTARRLPPSPSLTSLASPMLLEDSVESDSDSSGHRDDAESLALDFNPRVLQRAREDHTTAAAAWLRRLGAALQRSADVLQQRGTTPNFAASMCALNSRGIAAALELPSIEFAEVASHAVRAAFDACSPSPNNTPRYREHNTKIVRLTSEPSHGMHHSSSRGKNSNRTSAAAVAVSVDKRNSDGDKDKAKHNKDTNSESSNNENSDANRGHRQRGSRRPRSCVADASRRTKTPKSVKELSPPRRKKRRRRCTAVLDDTQPVSIDLLSTLFEKDGGATVSTRAYNCDEAPWSLGMLSAVCTRHRRVRLDYWDSDGTTLLESAVLAVTRGGLLRRREGDCDARVMPWRLHATKLLRQGASDTATGQSTVREKLLQEALLARWRARAHNRHCSGDVCSAREVQRTQCDSKTASCNGMKSTGAPCRLGLLRFWRHELVRCNGARFARLEQHLREHQESVSVRLLEANATLADVELNVQASAVEGAGDFSGVVN